MADDCLACHGSKEVWVTTWDAVPDPRDPSGNTPMQVEREVLTPCPECQPVQVKGK